MSWSRRSVLVGAAAAAGCRVRIQDPPELGEWRWSVDRTTLPDVSIRALHVATVKMKGTEVVAGSHDHAVYVAPITTYLLQHPTAGWFLIDAAYGQRTDDDPFEYPGRTSVKILELEVERPLSARLGELGLTPADIHNILLTHAHQDHIGGVEDFPEATLWTDAREWEDALTRGSLKGYDSLPYAEREPRFFAFEGTEPYGPFAQHVDLFGDGTVIVLPAPGHTAGEVCVLVNRPTRSYLFTGDAAWVDDNWRIPAPAGNIPARLVFQDWRQSCDPLWRIRAWSARYPDELQIIAGHEPESFGRLPLWPATFA